MQDRATTTRTGAFLDGAAAPRRLADFTTDRRVLLLIAMAVAIGTAATVAAWLLVDLIAIVSNLIWLGQFSTVPVNMGTVARSPWMVLAPVCSGLVIGLMARFGSEKIPGTAFPRLSKRSLSEPA